MLVLDLPIPPSVNNLFVNVPGRGRVPGRQYQTWKTLAGIELAGQRPERIAGTIVIEIEARRPTATSDVSNRIKPLEDLLVRHGVIEDDRFVQKVSAEWSEQVAKGRCRVTVRPA